MSIRPSQTLPQTSSDPVRVDETNHFRDASNEEWCKRTMKVHEAKDMALQHEL